MRIEVATEEVTDTTRPTRWRVQAQLAQRQRVGPQPIYKNSILHDQPIILEWESSKQAKVAIKTRVAPSIRPENQLTRSCSPWPASTTFTEKRQPWVTTTNYLVWSPAQISKTRVDWSRKLYSSRRPLAQISWTYLLIKKVEIMMMKMKTKTKESELLPSSSGFERWSTILISLLNRKHRHM